jgi:FixJ family two-component response regulator
MSATNKKVVHLVDDDASMLTALSRLLELAGYAVQSFASAAAFLDQHRADHRGCIVTDLRMPGMSGLDLQMALARDGNPLPIIFVTGHGDIPTSVHAMRRGAEDFLTKPVRKADLLASVERAWRWMASNSGSARISTSWSSILQR